MVLEKQSHFVGSEIDTVCFSESLLRVMEVFARQIFNE